MILCLLKEGGRGDAVVVQVHKVDVGSLRVSEHRLRIEGATLGESKLTV